MNKEQLIKKYKDMYIAVSLSSDKYERNMKLYRKNSIAFRNNYEGFSNCEYQAITLKIILNDLENLK